MKKTTLALAMSLMISGAVNAALEANIGASSNYMFRGVTLSDKDAAVSGGLDYSSESGGYAGTWMSTMTSANGEEVDFYAGFSKDDYDLGVIYYYYPDQTDADYAEIYGSYTMGAITASMAYTPWSQVDDTVAQESFIKGDIYYSLAASAELSDGWGVTGTVGYMDFEDDGVGGTDTSYAHMQLDLTKTAGDFGDVTFSLSKADAESGDDDPAFFVSLSKSF